MNTYYIGTALNLASLYMVAGVGSSISIKSGEYNLGGEGQIYLGGFVTAMFLTSKFAEMLPAGIGYVLAFVLAFVISGLLGLITGVLYRKQNASILFTSFISSVAIIPLIDGLIAGPCRNKTGNLLATQFISEKYRFHSLWRPSNLNSTFFMAIILCIVMYFLFERTATGRRLCIYGISHNFADYAGYKSKEIIYKSTFYSAAYHGACGFLAVCGTYFTCHSGFYSGMGWNALTTALIVGGNPLLLLFSSVFMGGIITYSNTIGMYSNLGFDVSSIIQAFILFVIANVRGRKYVA